MRKAVLLTLLALAASVVVAIPADAGPPPVSYTGLALTPPMGFNDWNAFGCNVSASLIEQTALALHENGMQAAGYQYVNIDDCWMAGRDIPRTDPARATAGRG